MIDELAKKIYERVRAEMDEAIAEDRPYPKGGEVVAECLESC